MAIGSILPKTVGSAGPPAGTNRQIQFNDNGLLGADANFVFDGAGNVGIGLSNPSYTLDVVGDINFTGNLTKDGADVFEDSIETSFFMIGV